MKKVFLSLIMLATVAFCSCTDKSKESLDQAILGHWIGYSTYHVDEGIVNPYDNNLEQCFVYLTFNSDNTFSMYMPHWWEIRRGTYTIQDGNKLNIVITGIGCLSNDITGPAFHEHPEGDQGHLETYGVSTFEEFAQQHPDEVNISVDASIADDHLILGEGFLGTPLTCYADNNNAFGIN